MPKEAKKLSIGYLIGAIVLFLIALYIIMMFRNNLPHDTDAVIILFYCMLFIPAGVFILLTFIRKLRRIIALALVLIAIGFVLSGYAGSNLFTSILNKGLSDPNRYADALRAIDNWAAMDLAGMLPESISKNAADQKMSLKLPYEDHPLVFHMEYKLPQAEYDRLKQEWLTKYADHEKTEEGDGFTSIKVYYTQNSASWSESVFYYYNDAARLIRLFVFEGDPSYV